MKIITFERSKDFGGGPVSVAADAIEAIFEAGDYTAIGVRGSDKPLCRVVGTVEEATAKWRAALEAAPAVSMLTPEDSARVASAVVNAAQRWASAGSSAAWFFSKLNEHNAVVEGLLRVLHKWSAR